MGKWCQGQVCEMVAHSISFNTGCQGQVWGNTGTFCCLIQHWVNVRVRCGETLAHSAVSSSTGWMSGSGVGKWWHILLSHPTLGECQGQVWGNGGTFCSHPTLGECQGQVWGNTGTFSCLIQHWVNVRVLAG